MLREHTKELRDDLRGTVRDGVPEGMSDMDTIANLHRIAYWMERFRLTKI